MNPIPLLVELCAGTAALSLRLERDGARPPVSRMGAKTGYADTILRVLGLVPGQRALRYLWCEPDPGVRLLLHAYRDAQLAKAAAAIIRSWAGEEPRALWERLRAEGAPRLPAGEVEAGEVARVIQIMASNELINVAWNDTEGRWKNTGKGGTTFGGPIGYGADRSPAKMDGLPEMPATIHPDAREVDPREVARWLYTAQACYRRGFPDSGYDDEAARGRNHPATVCGPVLQDAPTLPALIHPDAREVDPREVARWGFIVSRTVPQAWARGITDGDFIGSREETPDGSAGRAISRETLAANLTAVEVQAALIHPDARTVDPPALPPGTVAYMDPPYVGTTGYADDLPRAEVVALARRWAAAGATVAISEAEPIAELLADGWHAVRIDAERIGQRRTFSRQQAEWLTLSSPPAWRPSVQGALFGGAL